MKKSSQTADYPSFQTITGKIPVTLKNDLLFHFVMQNSKTALKGLICALKNLDSDSVSDVILQNPIEYGSPSGISVAEKNKIIVLDVKVILNSSEVIDIELQLYYDSNWIKRSLLYLCRTYDSLRGGEDYSKLLPTTLISIVDNSVGNISDGFYAHYLFMDTVTHRTYTSIFGINVLNLTRIDEATDADKANGLVYWAKLFSAATWEDLRSISNARPDLKEAAMTMYSANVQSSTRTLMEAHNKYLSDLATLTKYKEDAMRLQDELENYKAQNTDLHAQNTELQTQNTDLQTQNTSLQTQNTGLQTQLNQKEDELQKLLKLLAANNIDPDS